MMLTWKYSLPAFLVPFAFTLDPRGMGLLLSSTWQDAAIGTATAVLGVAGLAMGLGGWLIGAGPRPARWLAAAGGLLLFHPAPWADAAGLACLAMGVAIGRRRA